MDHFISVLIVVGIPAVIMSYCWVYIERDYPVNPFRWMEARRKNIEIARGQRISTLEHDLGYLPCSDETCYSCKKMLRLKEQPKQQISAMTGLVTDLYDRMVDLALHSPPPPTADPAKILK